DLHHRLAKAECGEDRTTAATDGPSDDIALVRFQARVDLGIRDLEPGNRRQLDLGVQELPIVGRDANSRSAPPRMRRTLSVLPLASFRWPILSLPTRALTSASDMTLSMQ